MHSGRRFRSCCPYCGPPHSFPAVNAIERLKAALFDRYRIERELGFGGMATVYLAEDLKHDRKVAVKVLKPELAAVLGADRFVVEIKTTAALQHPHILPLFDSGTADGFLFYVMPFIDGETLRSKLDRETQVGVDEAVKLTVAVADALDYAHRHGVIHRDIKPENILLHEGRPIVADFGIALAVSAAAGGRMTETGLSLGTPHYMSPEQATAEKEISGRSDVYSLASVMYEMLAGQPPHVGGSAQQIVMKIITETAASVTTLRKTVPRNVAAALETALEKLPADRFESAKAFAEALGNPNYTNLSGTGASGALPRGVTPRLFWATAAIAVIAICSTAAAFIGRTPLSPRAVARFELTPRGVATVTEIQNDRELSISPDGTRIAYVGNSGTQLFVRAMDALEPTPIVGDQKGRPRGPFFSPDGQWIGFVEFAAVSKLWKVAISGGPAVPISEFRGQRQGASWGEDGTIVFAAGDSSASGLWRVSADGGTPTRLTRTDRAHGEAGHVFPEFLPGGRSVLFTIMPVTGGVEGASVAIVDLTTGKYKVVLRGGSHAHYVSSGHLVFGVSDSLRAVSFDLKRLELSGTPTPVLASVATRGSGVAQFDVARDGTLIYVPTAVEAAAVPDRTLVWVDRQGHEEPIKAPARAYTVPRLSPDGTRIALEIRDQEQDIWFWSLTAQTLSRETFDPRGDRSPVWSPDGRRLFYFEERKDGLGALMSQPSSGGAPEELTRVSGGATDIAPDGSRVVTNGVFGGGSVDMSTLVGDPARNKHERLGLGTGLWQNGVVSPDGRWIAYEGAPTGLFQVYVRPFPDVTSGRWQVTTEGGTMPAWARNGKELFYLGPTGAMMSVRVDAGTIWHASDPAKLFDGQYIVGSARLSGRSYDVSPDGRRFLMIKPGGSGLAGPGVGSFGGRTRRTEQGIVVVQHWDEELKRLVPKK